MTKRGGELDGSPWEAALGGIVGAAAAMAIAYWIFFLQADRLDAPADETEAVGRILLGVLILGYALFAAGIMGILIGSTLFLAARRRDRIVSTLGFLIALELGVVPIGVAATLSTQDHLLNELIFAVSVGLITAVAPFSARALAIRSR